MTGIFNFKTDVISITDVGLERQANEDSCFVTETPNGYLFVVCDGMGGHIGGAEASRIAVHSIVDFFMANEYRDLRQALADSLFYANGQILNFVYENPDLQGMGTTACILLIQGNKAYFAHMGDSRIYLFCKQQQQLHRITQDHSFVQTLVDRGEITDEEAECHPEKNKILRALGIQEDIVPDVCTKPIQPANGDVFLICSDGLSGMVDDEHLQQILQQKISLAKKGNKMLVAAKQAGGLDNITLQLIQITSSKSTVSLFESKNPVRKTTSERSQSIINKILNLQNIKLIAITALFAALVITLTVLSFRGCKSENEIVEELPPPDEAGNEQSNNEVTEKIFIIKIRQISPKDTLIDDVKCPISNDYSTSDFYEDRKNLRNKDREKNAKYVMETINPEGQYEYDTIKIDNKGKAIKKEEIDDTKKPDIIK